MPRGCTLNIHLVLVCRILSHVRLSDTTSTETIHFSFNEATAFVQLEMHQSVGSQTGISQFLLNQHIFYTYL